MINRTPVRDRPGALGWRRGPYYHSGGNSFGARLAVAVADRLSLSYLQVWCDRPIRGVSHPKEFRRLPPLDMLAN